MDKRFDVVGIGVSVMDLVMVVDELPEEESVVRARERAVGLGGGVAVAMATAAKLGGRVAMADRLGHDAMSDAIVQGLSRVGVDVSCLQRHSEHHASVAAVLVGQATGARTIVYAPGSDQNLEWSAEIEEMIAHARVVHVNGRHLKVCQQAIEVAKQSETLVSFDGGAHRYRSEVLPLVEQSDVLIVAEHFAQSHWQAVEQEDSCELSARELTQFMRVQFSASVIGVTCGEHGSWFCNQAEAAFHQPALLAQPLRDTTGCGDSFHGAFALAVARNASIPKCAQFASEVASRNAERLGAFGIEHIDADSLPAVPTDS